MSSFVKFVLSFVKCHVKFCQALCQVFVKCYVKFCCTSVALWLGTAVLCVLQVLSGNIYVWIREGVKIFTYSDCTPSLCGGSCVIISLVI